MSTQPSPSLQTLPLSDPNAPWFQKWYYKIELEEGDVRCAVGAMYDHGSAGPKGLRFPTALAGYGIAFPTQEGAEKVAAELEAYFADQSMKESRTKNKETSKKK